MTIGIGVLPTTGGLRDPSEVRPDCLILVADTMGSFGDAYSHDRLHKTIVFADNHVYATVSDHVERGAELMPLVNNQIALTAIGQRTHGSISHAIAMSCFLYKTERFAVSVLPEYRLPPEVLDPRKVQIPADISKRIEDEWRKFDMGCDLIIGAFDFRGQALLYYVSGAHSFVENYSFPGFCAIGTGADYAMFWLSHRQHILSFGTKRAAFHAFEAKLMAKESAHVNEHIDICIATKDKYWGLTTHRKEDFTRTDTPFNLNQLRGWSEEYGPRSTMDLD